MLTLVLFPAVKKLSSIVSAAEAKTATGRSEKPKPRILATTSLQNKELTVLKLEIIKKKRLNLSRIIKQIKRINSQKIKKKKQENQKKYLIKF